MSLRLLPLALVLAGTVAAQQPATPAGAPPATPPQGSAAQAGPRPYDQVIPRAAKSDSGLFLVHRVGPRLYFEVPDSLIGRDMLLITRIHRAPEDLSPFLNAGSSLAEQLVRWEREGERVLLRPYSFRYVADDSLPIARSVEVNTYAPILRAFPIAAENRDSSAAVLDVTALF